MLMHTKFQTPEVATDFPTMLVLHDQQFNSSGQPYTGEHATIKRKAETSEQKPDAGEIPSETGDPDTKEKFVAERKNTLVVEALGQEFLFFPQAENYGATAKLTT